MMLSQNPGSSVLAVSDDDRFEVRLGRVRSASGSRRTVGFFERVSKASKAKRARAGRASGRNRSSVRQMAFQRRVLVKASIKTMARAGVSRLKAHLNYIQRDGTDARGERAELYGRGVEEGETGLRALGHETDGSEFADRCKDDRHHFRFIVAPEDSAKMQNLSAFTRDLVGQMERDLDTKLDWVATDHYDTGQPHTHLVIRGVRDNGQDLVIPRQYMAYGLRERAQALVDMELGPVSQIEGRVRLARTVEAEHHTPLDRTLSAKLHQGEIDMSEPVDPGRVWHRQLQVRRLQTLARMGLADRLGSGRWQVRPDFTETLRRMGDRKDIIRAIHRSMKEAGPELGEDPATRLVTERNMFNPARVGAQPVTGVVRHFGRPDDTQPGGFIVIDSLGGAPVHAKVADDETFETLHKGQLVTFTPHPTGPRKIDRSIAAFADRHGGIYSEARHATESDQVSPAYAQAHVRRLEALRRERLVARKTDGTWRIPADYLDRATDYEATRARRLPTHLQRDSQQTLREMERATGVTWLDRRLAAEGIGSVASSSMRRALDKRLQTLAGMGFRPGRDGRLPHAVLSKLETADLRAAGTKLQSTLGKPYKALGDARTVNGVYRQALERPSGKFAVIERSKDFTLVPWRPVMERRLGQTISGRVSGGGISWDVTGRKGPSR